MAILGHHTLVSGLSFVLSFGAYIRIQEIIVIPLRLTNLHKQENKNFENGAIDTCTNWLRS